MPVPSALVRGLPTLIPFVGPETLERRFGRPFRLRLGANESPFGPSPVALEAMRRQAANAQNYGDPEGWDLRSALAEKHGVAMENVVLAAGIDDLLALFCRAYGDPGSPIVTTLGSYPTLEYGAMGAGMAIHRVPYRDDRVDLEGLAERASEVGAKIVYIANPDNPSGSVHAWSEILRLRTRLSEEALLIVDEAYSDFAPPEANGPVDTSDGGIVRLRTFSKANGLAGMRVGYALGHEQTVGALNKIRMHFGISCVSLAGALASLSDHEHLERVVRETGRGREQMKRLAEGAGLCTLPSATNFILVDVGTKERADRLLDSLLQEGVFVRKPSLPPLDRCVRITIGTRQDLEELAPIFNRSVER